MVDTDDAYASKDVLEAVSCIFSFQHTNLFSFVIYCKQIESNKHASCINYHLALHLLIISNMYTRLKLRHLVSNCAVFLSQEVAEINSVFLLCILALPTHY